MITGKFKMGKLKEDCKVMGEGKFFFSGKRSSGLDANCTS